MPFRKPNLPTTLLNKKVYKDRVDKDAGKMPFRLDDKTVVFAPKGSDINKLRKKYLRL